MSWIYAASHTAKVIELQTFWYWTYEMFIRNAMRKRILFIFF